MFSWEFSKNSKNNYCKYKIKKQNLQDSNTFLILHINKQILTFELDVGFSEL